ncbi:MAG: rhodanese-like domain-containing protein [Chloroflexota bacterium]
MARKTLAEEREGTASGLFRRPATEVPRIGPRQLADRLEGDDPPLVLEVRSRSSYEQDQARIPGSVRVPPDEVDAWGQTRPRDRAIVTYCT